MDDAQAGGLQIVLEGGRWKMDAREQRQAAAKLTAPSSALTPECGGTPGNTLYPLCRSCTDQPRELQPTRPHAVGPLPSAAQSEAVPLGTAWKPAAALINSPGLPTGTHMCLFSEVLDGLTR